MTKTIVLGLDGACWPLLNPWLAVGDLPNLAALRSKSTWGPLRSQFPPVTSPNWRCYATGRNPAKLGVFWWEIVDRQNQAIRHPNGDDYQTQPFWQDLAAAGQRVGVLNFPTGFPPRQVPNGFFTASGPGAKQSGFAQPPTWEDHIREKSSYRVHPERIYTSAEQISEGIDDLLDLMQSRFDAAFELLDDGLDFLHITLFYINSIQHYCYDGPPTLKAWKLVDRNMERLIEYARAGNFNLLLMSDHGCGPIDTVFHANTWLQSRGYLAAKKHARTRLTRVGINRQVAINLARKLSMDRWLARVLPARLQRWLPSAGGTMGKAAKGEGILWAGSRAVASGQGLIYLLLDKNDRQYESIRQAVIDELASLQKPDGMGPIANQIYRAEEVYNGPFLDVAPDIVFEQASGVHTSGGLGAPDVFSKPGRWAAENLMDGLFLAFGPDFGRQAELPGTRIIDLAPTLLHLYDLPVPDDVDGRVLSNIFAEDSPAANRDLRIRSADLDTTQARHVAVENDLHERLQDLGYLD